MCVPYPQGNPLYKVGVSLYLWDMDIEKFIMDHYDLRVNEDKNGMKVLFVEKGSEVLGENVVWFERAKKGWSKKPISSKNNFIIVDANLSSLLEFMNTYFSLNEENYPEVRNMMVRLSIDTIDNHLNYKG